VCREGASSRGLGIYVVGDRSAYGLTWYGCEYSPGVAVGAITAGRRRRPWSSREAGNQRPASRLEDIAAATGKEATESSESWTTAWVMSIVSPGDAVSAEGFQNLTVVRRAVGQVAVIVVGFDQVAVIVEEVVALAIAGIVDERVHQVHVGRKQCSQVPQCATRMRPSS